jgi:SAM-dependent methyltransferase
LHVHDDSPAPATTAYDDWARYYDLGEGDRQPYLDFYTSLVNASTRSVLEIGCGTGVIASAIAARLRDSGADAPMRVVGFDASGPMLEIARARDPGLEWVLGDMRNPPVQGRFDLVFCCFNTFQFMLSDDDLAQAFRAARALTADGGRFAFDLYQPNLPYLERTRTDSLAREIERDGRRLQIREDARYSPGPRVLELDWRLVDASDPQHILARTHFSIRQYFPQDIDRLLADAAFRVDQRWGGLDRSGFDAGAKKQVLVCTPA